MAAHCSVGAALARERLLSGLVGLFAGSQSVCAGVAVAVGAAMQG